MSMTVREFENDENSNTRTMERMSIRVMNLVNRRIFLYASNQCHFTFWMLTYPVPLQDDLFLDLTDNTDREMSIGNCCRAGSKGPKRVRLSDRLPQLRIL